MERAARIAALAAEAVEPVKGRLITAAIAYVFTIRRAAQIFGRDEDLLGEQCQRLEPEDGMLWVHDMDSKISTFSERGMETLREIGRDQIDKVP